MQFKSIAFMALAAASSVAFAQDDQAQPNASAAPAPTVAATPAPAPTVPVNALPPPVGTLTRNPKKKFGPGRPIQKDIGGGLASPPPGADAGDMDDGDITPPGPPPGKKATSKDEKLVKEIKKDVKKDVKKDLKEDDDVDEKRGGGHRRHTKKKDDDSSAVGLERNFALMMVAGGVAAMAVGYM